MNNIYKKIPSKLIYIMAWILVIIFIGIYIDSTKVGFIPDAEDGTDKNEFSLAKNNRITNNDNEATKKSTDSSNYINKVLLNNKILVSFPGSSEVTVENKFGIKYYTYEYSDDNSYYSAWYNLVSSDFKSNPDLDHRNYLEETVKNIATNNNGKIEYIKSGHLGEYDMISYLISIPYLETFSYIRGLNVIDGRWSYIITSSTLNPSSDDIESYFNSVTALGLDGESSENTVTSIDTLQDEINLRKMELSKYIVNDGQSLDSIQIDSKISDLQYEFDKKLNDLEYERKFQETVKSMGDDYTNFWKDYHKRVYGWGY